MIIKKIHKPVEDAASDLQSLPDEDYEQLVPEEDDNVNDNIDDNVHDFVGNGANSDVESIGGNNFFNLLIYF